VILSDMTGFILARLDEDERDAGLFHEFTCPAQEQLAGGVLQGTWCRCPVPARILARVQAARDIIAGCERQLRTAGSGAPGMPPAAAGIQAVLGAMTLDYELDPRWQEQWRP
jgi:hypothetical protein